MMKNKRKAQISEKVYFGNTLESDQKLIKKGKNLKHQIPSVKIINDILKQYYTFLVEPEPFQKLKFFHKNQKESNVNYLNSFKLTPNDKEIISQIFDDESQYVPQSKQYHNSLLLTCSNSYLLEYIHNSQLRQVKLEFDRPLQQLNVTDFTENIIQFTDQTGVQQLLKHQDKYFIKHLYCVEILDKNKIDQKYTFQEMVDQIEFSEISNNLYMLTQGYFRSQNTIIKQFNKQQSQAYQIQSFCLNFNPHCIFFQSLREIQLFDLRKNQLNTILSVEMQDLLTNKICAIHQFEQSQYIMISTNQDLQYYDLRNTRTPISIQKHGCSELSINRFVKMSYPEIDFQKGISYLQQPEGEIVVGYSDQGNTILIKFNPLTIDSILTTDPTLRTCTNLLSNQTFQYASDDQTKNGLPIIIGNSSMYSKQLKTRGFQLLASDERIFSFSLDQQGGLGVQIFDNDLNPISKVVDEEFQVNKILTNEYKSVQKECQKFQYDEIFDDFKQFSDSDLELQQVYELKSQKKKIKIDLKIQEYEYQDNSNSLSFEQEILNFNQEEQNQENIEKITSNTQFILTPQIIDKILNQ